MEVHRTKKRRCLPSVLLGVAMCVMNLPILNGQDMTSPLIKSGLIHKFAQYTVWPQEEGIDTFKIGVYGEEAELISNLLLLESFGLKGKPISVVQFARASDISGIHLLYVCRDRNVEISRIWNQIAGSPTLMVSDRVRNQDQIMINFLPMEDGKTHFEVKKTNINAAGMDVAPDLLLLGGTEVDAVGIFKQSQRTIRRFREQIEELNESFNSKSRQIEEQNREIERQKREIETQKELVAEQERKQRRQQEEMDARAEELARVLKEVEVKQQTLDSKIELIGEQEKEISNQRAEIENRNRILTEQEDQIETQEKQIEEQVSQLSNFANTVARQRTFLYIIIAICVLVVFLVFFIYKGYKIKRNANLEIELKNTELQRRQEEILAQSEEIQEASEEVTATNEALEVQKRELELALNNLKLAQSQLIQSEKMASVGVLTAGIAHELNNPINFVRGNVNPLRRDIEDILAVIKKYEHIVEAKKLGESFGEVDELKAHMDFNLLIQEVSSLLEGIEEGADRSSLIVKGLRSFSRLDDDKRQTFDVHEGIDSSLLLLQNKTKDRIQIRKDYGDFRAIACYPNKLKQVFMNVLTNSIQAIEGKGVIFIQTISSASVVKIIIKDNGKGMSPEVKEHIFEPFYTTKDVGQGTGLGLSISFGIIEQHKGHMEVLSEPGKGTEFIISLPNTQID